MMSLRRRLTDYGTSMIPQRHAASTIKNYSSAEKRWFEFCADAGYSWRNWSETTTFHFVCWRRTVGLNMHNGEPVTAATLKSQLSAIKARLLNRGCRNLVEYSRYTMPRTSALLSAISRREIPSYKKPLTGFELRRIIAALPTTTYDSVVFAWMVAFAHNTIRRPSEVMPTMDRELVAGDIKWSNGSFRPKLTPPYDATASYQFNRSKTNQTGRLQTALMWCRCASSVCALCRLRNLYRRCPWEITPKTPLLLLVTGKVLDYRAAMRVLKALCIRVGLNPNDYGLHSCRRGGFQDAVDEGCTDVLINMQAHWKNNRSRRPYEKTREMIDAKKRLELGRMLAAPGKDSALKPNPKSWTTSRRTRRASFKLETTQTRLLIDLTKTESGASFNGSTAKTPTTSRKRSRSKRKRQSPAKSRPKRSPTKRAGKKRATKAKAKRKTSKAVTLQTNRYDVRR